MTEHDRSIELTEGEKAGELAAIALAGVPVAGGVMAGIASTVISRRQNRRLSQFLLALAADLKALEGRVNAEFLKSEDFQDLAEDIFTKAAETRQQETLDAFRAIFLNTVLAHDPSYGEAEEIAKLVQGWQPRHVILLRILADPVAADRHMGHAVGPGGGLMTSISTILKKLLPEWDDDQIDRTWQDLYDAKVHRTPGTKTMMTDQGINQLRNRLTDFGTKVAKYLTIPE